MNFIMSKVFEKYESGVRSYCRSFPTVFEKAKGSVLTDRDGKDYIDFFSGAGGVNYGHNNPYIIEKMTDYLTSGGVIHSLDMYTVKKEEFITCFQEKILKPRGFDYKIQFAGPTGTNAVEAALKLSRKVTGRTNVFAFMGAFHGMTMGSLSLTTDQSSRDAAGVPLIGVTHIPAPYMFENLDTINYMETLITDDHSGVEKPAAIILESVQADGGIYVFDVEWLKALRALCDKYGILLILDDIQAGCGRSGNFFSFERAGIVPDIVTVSKSIGGVGMPMALVLYKPELDIWQPGEHTGTFRGNQLSMVAAKAAIEVFVNEKIDQKTLHSQKIMEDYLNNNVLTINDKIKVRGIGLIWGIDLSQFGDEELSKKVMQKCFEKGLILERVGRNNAVIKLMPPLVIEDDLLIKGLNILKDVLTELL